MAVKRIVAFLMLMVYLSSATELYQLLKLPTLVQHYLCHKQEDPALTVIDFFAMHYAEQHEIDADYAQDMKLPFKTYDGSFTMFTSVVPAHYWELYGFKHVFQSIQFLTFNEDQTDLIFANTVWQPPKTSC